MAKGVEPSILYLTPKAILSFSRTLSFSFSEGKGKRKGEERGRGKMLPDIQVLPPFSAWVLLEGKGKEEERKEKEGKKKRSTTDYISGTLLTLLRKRKERGGREKQQIGISGITFF